MTTANTHTFGELHKLLEQLEQAEKLLALGPRRIAVAEQKVTAAQATSDAQKEEIQRLKKAADEVSLNLKTSEAEIVKHKLRLNDATSNKEYQIIQGQIKAAEESSGALEDQVLTMLGDVDVANEELVKLDDAVKEQQKKTEDVCADVASREPGLKTDIERLTQEIAGAEAIIPSGESASTYKRLRAAMGAAAMAAVEETYCSECNTAATPQDRVRINMNEFVLCRQCGRILYNVAER